jgi:hypothetical protein
VSIGKAGEHHLGDDEAVVDVQNNQKESWLSKGSI